MTDRAETDLVVAAIQDLTRVTIALSGTFTSKSDAMRRLAELSIPVTRIAAILAVPPNDVRSALSKARKRNTPGKDITRGRQTNDEPRASDELANRNGKE